MFIDTDGKILFGEEAESFTHLMLGGIWSEFTQTIPEPQAKLLDRAFNLILLSYPESLLPTIIQEDLVDEGKETSERKQLIFERFADNIIQGLVNAGFDLNEDISPVEHLHELCNILSLIFDLDQYEDVVGIYELLASRDIPPAQRYIGVMQKLMGEQIDFSVYEEILADVSEVTLDFIRDALARESTTDEDQIEPYLVKRVRENREFLQDTLAGKHVMANGALGGKVENFLSFYQKELKALLGNPTHDNLLQYGHEILGFHLVSDLNNHQLKDAATNFLTTAITDYTLIAELEEQMNKWVLTDE